MRLLIMGPPGAGKGTMAAYIKKIYDIPHISTGELYREAIAKHEPLSANWQAAIWNARNWSPTPSRATWFRRRSIKTSIKGISFGRVPRTIPQAEALDDILARKRWKIDLVLNLT